MKRMICVLSVAFAILLCVAASAEKVVATSFPCYDFARRIAGDACEVDMLISPGTEVHSFEPTPSDILNVGGADLVVCIGGVSDAWMDDILDSFGEEAPEVIRLIQSVETLEQAHDEAHDGHDHGHEGHDHGQWDEHIWTSPKNAMRMVDALAEGMSAQMPAHAELFRANADAYIAEIAQIDAELEQIVAGSARRELVFADRFPFLYLAHDYGIGYSAAFSSCAADTEPSAQTLVSLIKKITADQIPVVYTIEMSTGTIARTLAEETGVEILTLHSAQTVTQAEFDAQETYVSLMKKNLEAIEKGLNG